MRFIFDMIKQLWKYNVPNDDVPIPHVLRFLSPDWDTPLTRIEAPRAFAAFFRLLCPRPKLW